MQDLTAFEKKLNRAMSPETVDPGFQAQLAREIKLAEEAPVSQPFRFFGLNRAWTYALTALSLLVLVIAAVGPTKVLAQIGAIFGYVPGVGVVDVSSPIRILAEPASVTKDGVTLTIESMVLTAKETTFQLPLAQGLPADARIKDFNHSFCDGSVAPYLRLPDGSRVEVSGMGFGPVPADVNEAVYVEKCIPFTLTGKAPEDWEIPLRFVPAPADMAIYQVTEVAAEELSAADESSADGVAKGGESLSLQLLRVVEKNDSYVFLLVIPRSDTLRDPVYGFDSNMRITDAAGVEYPLDWPDDNGQMVNAEWNNQNANYHQVEAWEIKKAGITFPLHFERSMEKLIYPAPIDSAPISFDPGKNPQLGEVWPINQTVDFNGVVSYKLVSVDIDPMTKHGQGYRFNFEGLNPDYALSAELASMSDPFLRNYTEDREAITFSMSLIYEGKPLPTGPQRVTFRYTPPAIPGEEIVLSTTWSPEDLK